MLAGDLMILLAACYVATLAVVARGVLRCEKRMLLRKAGV